MFVLSVWAQPAIPSERPVGASPSVTNLSQLSKLLDSSPRIVAGVRLDAVVCSMSRAEIGVVAVKDQTGSEVLELGPRRVAIAAGDIIHIEGQRCLLRRRDIGVEITRAPALDNDRDGNLLFLDSPEVPLTRIGHENVPSPIVSSLHAPISNSEPSQWISVEGRVVFVSRSGRGLRFELHSQPDSIWVMVADGGELDPTRLLNSRIRVAGIGRAVMAPNRDLVLGELSVATSDNITILEDSGAATANSSSARTLAAVGQIQSLSKEEAARHLPVKIQGVVTSLAPPVFGYMSIQDETRGIFVRLSSVHQAGHRCGPVLRGGWLHRRGRFRSDSCCRRRHCPGEGTNAPACASYVEGVNQRQHGCPMG